MKIIVLKKSQPYLICTSCFWAEKTSLTIDNCWKAGFGSGRMLPTHILEYVNMFFTWTVYSKNILFKSLSFFFTVEITEGTSLCDDFEIVKSLAFVTEKFYQLTTIISSLREYHCFGKKSYIKSLFFYTYSVMNNFD